MDFTAGHRITHTHAHTHTHTNTHAHTAAASQSGASATVRRNEAACAFKFRDPLFTAGAGWQGALVHAALNNWDCKVNVRRIVKDGSSPHPTASVPASVSWLHTSKSHTSAVLEPLSVMVFQNIKTDVNGDSCLTEERKLYGRMK